MQIILAFSSKKIVSSLSNLLQKSGYPMPIVCPNLPSLLRISYVSGDIVISSCFLNGSSLYSFIEENNHINYILIDQKDHLDLCKENAIKLTSPLKEQDIINAIENINLEKEQKKKNTIKEAKNLLKIHLGYDEPTAHKFLQSLSMQTRKPIENTALYIIKKYTK